MSACPVKGALDPLRPAASSPMDYGTAPEVRLPRYCIVEDVHGMPAPNTFSVSPTPERSSIPQLRPEEVSPGSFVSPIYDNEMHLSGHTFPSPDRIGFSPNGAALAAVAGAGIGVGGVVVQHQRSGAASQSRNGYTTLASSVSGLHITQSGVVIPPIQGIPQPSGLPPPTPVQYAKVKQRGKAGQKRSRLAVKGAFSNMTSVAVLQQVQPFQKKTRQVEAAGWSRYDYAGESVEGDTHTGDEGRAVAVNGTSSAVGVSPPAVPRPAAVVVKAAAAPECCNGRTSASRHSRSSSVASMSPSEAAMVAAAWEEDAAAAAVAASGHLTTCDITSGSHCDNNNNTNDDDDDDDWDRVEEEAMRIQAMMLQQLQQQLAHQSPPPPPQQLLQQSPVAPTALHCSPSPPRYHSPVVVCPSDPTEEAAPYAVRTAASANRSPTSTRVTPPRLPSPGNDIYSAHRAKSPAARTRSHSGATRSSPHTAVTPATACPPRSTTTATTTPTRTPGRNTAASRPVGIAACAAKGQQRRAEADAAQQARAAAAAGTPLPSRYPAAQGHDDEEKARRPRKLSVLPAPRGFDTYAQRGHARRSTVEQAEAARLKAEAANCTHAPRINRRTSTTSAGTGTAAAGDSRRPSDASAAFTSGAALSDTVANGNGGGGAARVSVFDRLSHEAEGREERQRQLAQKFTPLFVPQRVTAAAEAAAGEEPGNAARLNRAGDTVFEGLYALAKKPAATAQGERSEGAAEVGAVSQEDATVKKSKAEIEEHLRDMENREEERRLRRARQLATQAAEAKDTAHHPTLDPKTTALADRARARYRAREEQQRLQEAAEAGKHGGSRGAAKPPAHRTAHTTSPADDPVAPAAAAAAASDSETASRQHPAVNTPARRSLAAEFLAQQQRTEERKMRHLEQLRLQRADEELRECTFRPQLNTASTRMAQRVLVETFELSGADDTTVLHRPPPSSYRSTSSAEAELLLPRSVAVSSLHSRSGATSARSRSLGQELRRASPVVGPRQQHPHYRDVSTADEVEEEEEESFTQQVRRRTPLDDDGTVPRSPEPLAAQLRNLEEMLREWKELERECSPMLRQRPPEEGLVE